VYAIYIIIENIEIFIFSECVDELFRIGHDIGGKKRATDGSLTFLQTQNQKSRTKKITGKIYLGIFC
jgi:hypothetical protein